MEKMEFFAALNDFVNALQKSGYSGLEIAEIVKESFVNNVVSTGARPDVLSTLCAVCATSASGLCDGCDAELKSAVDEALYRQQHSKGVSAK